MKRILVLLLFLPLIVKGQIVTTICGNGSSGETGDGGPATAATISASGFGIFDAFGNYYFVEGPGNRIRKIDTSGIITAFVGTGDVGFSGDGGPASAATLQYPKEIATDRFGNLYIADCANQRIRKVDAVTNIINTIAGNGIVGDTGNGGPATAAVLGYPYGLCIDPYGNIYIGEQAYNDIRKIDTNGIISLIAGTPGIAGNSGDGGPATNATLSFLIYLCSDEHGNIYTSTWNVRKIDVVTGIITNFAGNYTNGYTGDSTLADTSEISVPFALNFDNYGALFLAEKDNNRIRKVDTNGFLYNIVGNGIGGFNGDGGVDDTTEIYQPEGVAFDPCGNMYFNDLGNGRIRKVTFDTSCGHFRSTEVVNSKLDNQITLFPNPTSSSLTITSPQPITQIIINDLLGQTVYSDKTGGEFQVQADVSSLQPGIYFVRVNGTEVRKFVKE